MTHDYLNIPAKYDSFPTLKWDAKEAYRLWKDTDENVSRFESKLGTQMNLVITHEWDDGLTFHAAWGDCLDGCDDCGSHKGDWENVEAQMNPMTRLYYEVLKRQVPLYLDANSKVS
jgi:hypothetical protein